MELEPLARGKRWILKPCSLDDMEAVKDSFSLLINLLEEKDFEPSRMWNTGEKSGSPGITVPAHSAHSLVMVWYQDCAVVCCSHTVTAECSFVKINILWIRYTTISSKVVYTTEIGSSSLFTTISAHCMLLSCIAIILYGRFYTHKNIIVCKEGILLLPCFLKSN